MIALPSPAEVALVLENRMLADALLNVPGPGWWVGDRMVPDLCGQCVPQLHDPAFEAWIPVDAMAIAAEAVKRGGAQRGIWADVTGHSASSDGLLRYSANIIAPGVPVRERRWGATAREAALRLLAVIIIDVVPAPPVDRLDACRVCGRSHASTACPLCGEVV